MGTEIREQVVIVCKDFLSKLVLEIHLEYKRMRIFQVHHTLLHTH